LSESLRAAAHHGAAAFAGALTFALLAALSVLAMAPLHLAGRTASVSVVSMPSLAHWFGAPDAPSLYDEESALGSRALLDRWSPYLAEASRRFHIPQAWIRAVMRQESGGRTVGENDRPLTSTAGAQGLMQVMPGTYDEVREIYGLGRNAYDPHDNVIAGTSYLRQLYRQYGYPALFAAYNDGPGNYERHLHKGRDLPKETVDYLASVTAHADAAAGHLTAVE
jgi:soluble lytic murein transglycosylase-like protein